jgi:hypothetical protein
MSRRTLSSLLRLRVGDCSNCPHWVRCLLLVYFWIRRRGAPRSLPFRAHRHCPRRCCYLARRSRILLFSNMGAEKQTVFMYLLDYCRRKCTYNPCIFQAFDVFLNTECGDPIRCIDMAVRQGQYYSQIFINLDHKQRLGTHGWEVCEYQDGLLCTHTRFGRSGHTISHIFSS